MVNAPAPSKDTALFLAEHYWNHRQHQLNIQISWDWLFVWGFYDLWIEEYWDD
jgi:hypothetical protein